MADKHTAIATQNKSHELKSVSLIQTQPHMFSFSLLSIHIQNSLCNNKKPGRYSQTIRVRDTEKRRELVSSGHDRAFANMVSQQPWLTALGLRKIDQACQ